MPTLSHNPEEPFDDHLRRESTEPSKNREEYEYRQDNIVRLAAASMEQPVPDIPRPSAQHIIARTARADAEPAQPSAFRRLLKCAGAVLSRLVRR